VKIAEKVADVFNILHDGSIEEWWFDKDVLTLKISCQYLAEIINPTFNFFNVELIGITTVELEPWWDDVTLNEIITSHEDVFKGELEILSAKVLDDNVQVICNQWSKSLAYSGGNLLISCKQIEVYDEAKGSLSLSGLNDICNSYWGSFGKS